MEQSPTWEANRITASQEIPRILWNSKVDYDRQLYLFWASSIQSMPPHLTSWRPIFILSSHLRLGFPSGLFPSGFPTKTLYTPLLSPYVLHAPPISFFSILSPEQYWVRSTYHKAPHYVVFSHFPVTLSLLGPNILLNTLFSNILSLPSSLSVSDQVSHPYKTSSVYLNF